MQHQDLACPNPCCHLFFTTHDAICVHLSTTNCSEWAAEHIKTMLEHIDAAGSDKELDNEFLNNRGMRFWHIFHT